MKKFNLNDSIYIQITETGWKHLKKTVGQDYINHSILPYEEEINGEKWYKLQAHTVFSLLPIVYGGQLNYKPEVLINDNDLYNF